jgi:hypothetical protein
MRLNLYPIDLSFKQRRAFHQAFWCMLLAAIQPRTIHQSCVAAAGAVTTAS